MNKITPHPVTVLSDIPGFVTDPAIRADSATATRSGEATFRGLSSMSRALRTALTPDTAREPSVAKRSRADLPGPKLSAMHQISAGLARLTNFTDRLLQPIVSIKPLRNGRKKIRFGERTFFSGKVTIESEGHALREILVIAERNFHGDDEAAFGQAFYPLDRNLKPDMSTALYKRDGKWGIASRANHSDPSARWLAADAFDKIAAEGFKTGFHRIGDREFCVASRMQQAKSSSPSKPFMLERIRGATPAEDRYHAVNADLTCGDTLHLPHDQVASDPFIGQISAQLHSHLSGRLSLSGAQPLALANAAAVNAFRCGASIHEAIALGVELVSARGRVVDAHSLSTYSAVGAAAGLLHRSGATPEAATTAARSMLQMAEVMPSPQVATVSYNPLTLPAGARRRFGVLDLTYRNAQADFDAMKTSLSGMDRSTRGADLSALTAAARQLFTEKGYTPAQLPGIAAEAARLHGATLGARADEAAAAADTAGLAVLAARAEVAGLEAQLAPEHVGWSARSLLSSLRGSGETPIANPHVNAIKQRLQLARRILDLAWRQHAAASRQAEAAQRDVAQTAGEHGERLDTAVNVLILANRAASGNQAAAMVAARVASNTFRTAGDAPRARFAGNTAHLALLAGASENDAMAAAHLAAERYDAAPAVGYDTDDLRAIQVAYVQVASLGSTPPADDTQWRSRALAATAAIDLLAQPNPDHHTAARLMSGLVSGARPEAERPAAMPMPLFRYAETPSVTPSAAPMLPAIPEHYEPVASELDASKAPLVRDWGHAKIREVKNLGFKDTDGNTQVTYLIEVPGPKGRVWTEFSWSPNSNHLYGEIMVKPKNASDGQQAGHGKVLLAYNGTTGEWESFEKRTRDLKEKTLSVLKEIEELLDSRDDRLSLRRLPYRGRKSGYMKNLIGPFQTQMEEEIRLFVQGRHSQPAFKSNMSKLFIQLSKDLEHDRSRKKAIIRHQIDFALGMLSVAGDVSLGGARVAALF